MLDRRVKQIHTVQPNLALPETADLLLTVIRKVCVFDSFLDSTQLNRTEQNNLNTTDLGTDRDTTDYRKKGFTEEYLREAPEDQSRPDIVDRPIQDDRPACVEGDYN
ncbi:hypothetical protein GWI33_008681 [Rhynchophorus ferrugineus]|uniref:Uncharacterized protein n=1 Tax=Rhynchophorus ferrugineus TaxID=354439 RepID=A0A834IQI7_RHYFE|nr:hypothetical protein GWI33_008681 [Rhynchophorus ferrugineus]